MSTRRDYKSFDFILAIVVVALAVLGIVLIGSATGVPTADSLPAEFKGQIIWVLSGIVIMITAALIDFQFICKFYVPICILNIILLVFVLFYGLFLNPDPTETVFRSIYLPGNLGSIQPSEFNKIFMTIFFAKYIEKHQERINHIGFLATVALLAGLPVLLIMAEPSLSASMVTVVIVTVMLFVAKLDYKYVALALVVTVPFAAAIFYDVGNAIIERVPYETTVETETETNGTIEIQQETVLKTEIKVTYKENTMSPILSDKILSPYQISRLKSFANPEEGEDAMYQNTQALMALGSGQLSGKGLFNGEVYVPEAANDFIFTVLGEEFGFAGCVTVIFLIFIVVFRCIVIAMRSDIFYGKLIAAAVGGMLTFQTFCNVGVSAGLLPNTGMIFPFISAGGSAMWVFMALIGMVLNIGMTKIKPMFAD